MGLPASDNGIAQAMQKESMSVMPNPAGERFCMTTWVETRIEGYKIETERWWSDARWMAPLPRRI